MNFLLMEKALFNSKVYILQCFSKLKAKRALCQFLALQSLQSTSPEKNKMGFLQTSRTFFSIRTDQFLQRQGELIHIVSRKLGNNNKGPEVHFNCVLHWLPFSLAQFGSCCPRDGSYRLSEHHLKSSEVSQLV